MSEIQLSAHGITTRLPRGWEGRIRRRDPQLGGPGERGKPQFHPEERTYPIAHFANFPLPADVADYGSGAVELMTRSNLFIVLLEFGPESVGKALFATQGLPRNLSPDLFTPNQLQRTIRGQGGYQTFFTEAGRPFCLFIALGSYANRAALIRKANAVLAATTITPR
ncbi:MAG: hypothetical protein N2037_09790 [Acidimicrobiales bacterium]|nr:hypothetical protein [Acidimicrobiales bacterium]